MQPQAIELLLLTLLKGMALITGSILFGVFLGWVIFKPHDDYKGGSS